MLQRVMDDNFIRDQIRQLPSHQVWPGAREGCLPLSQLEQPEWGRAMQAPRRMLERWPAYCQAPGALARTHVQASQHLALTGEAQTRGGQCRMAARPDGGGSSRGRSIAPGGRTREAYSPFRRRGRYCRRLATAPRYRTPSTRTLARFYSFP